MSNPKSIERLLELAKAHGEDTCEPDHEVGDLQDIIRFAWSIMTDDQKKQVFESDAAVDLLSLSDEE